MTQWTNRRLSMDLDKNVEDILGQFASCADVVLRRVTITKARQKAAIIFIPEITDTTRIEQACVRPLLALADRRSALLHEDLQNELTILGMQQHHIIDDVIAAIAAGDAVLLLDGTPQATVLTTAKWEHRAVEKSDNEVSLRGSLQAFNEDTRTNIGLVRQFLRGHELKIEKLTCGRMTKTPVHILYLDPIAHPDQLQTVKQRLQQIKLDSVLDAGYIEQLIRDHPRSLFPTMGQTERPDRVAAQLVDGRIAIAVDHSPTMLTLPALFPEFFQVSEDYYGDFWIQSFLRLLRYAAFWVSLSLMSLYLIFLTYNPELLPTPLLLKLSAARMGIPSPTIVEVFFMGLLFEVLHEAGLRLPRPIGPAISIVGGLVVGEAAVTAGIVGAATVIAIAMAGILSFIIPNHSLAATLRLLRFPLLLITAMFGIVGFAAALLLLLLHMFSLTSFGEPYMQAAAPLRKRLLEDSIVRAPLDVLFKRSHNWGTKKGSQ